MAKAYITTLGATRIANDYAAFKSIGENHADDEAARASYERHFAEAFSHVSGYGVALQGAQFPMGIGLAINGLSFFAAAHEILVDVKAVGLMGV